MFVQVYSCECLWVCLHLSARYMQLFKQIDTITLTVGILGNPRRIPIWSDLLVSFWTIWSRFRRSFNFGTRIKMVFVLAKTRKLDWATIKATWQRGVGFLERVSTLLSSRGTITQVFVHTVFCSICRVRCCKRLSCLRCENISGSTCWFPCC